jgi:hypothetical protein
MPVCAISVDDKRAFGKAVGEELVRRHGKKRSYGIPEVRSAVRAQNYPADWACWAYALYGVPAEFADYHRSIGVTCDHATMKSEMVSALTDGASSSWFDVDMSWLEWPDIDLSSIFDFL